MKDGGVLEFIFGTGLARYLVRTLIILFLLVQIPLPILAERLDLGMISHMLNIIGQMDIYRSLFYALLPAALVMLFVPATRESRMGRTLLLLISIGAGLVCWWLVSCAPTWTRPDLAREPHGHGTRLAALYVASNAALLIWFHLGNRWTTRARNLIVRAPLLADLLCPMLVWSAYREDRPARFALPRAMPAALVCIAPFVPWLLFPLTISEMPKVDPAVRLIRPGAYFEGVIDPRDGAFYLTEQHTKRVLRVSPGDFEVVQSPPLTVYPVKRVGLDTSSRRLVLVSPPEGVTLVLDADTMELQDTIRIDGDFRDVHPHCIAWWDARGPTLIASCISGTISLCANGSTPIAQHTLGFHHASLLDEPRGELHLLGAGNLLMAMDDGTLTPKRRLRLPGLAERMAQSPDGQRLYITHPVLGRVSIVDVDTYRLTDSITAFPGVRAIAVDEQKGWLVLGGLSPVLEIRNIDDFSLVDRLLAPPWLRWVHVDAKRRMIYMTSGTHGLWALDLHDNDQSGRAGFWRRMDPFYPAVNLANSLVQALFGWQEPAESIEPPDSQILLHGQCPEGSWTVLPAD